MAQNKYYNPRWQSIIILWTSLTLGSCSMFSSRGVVDDEQNSNAEASSNEASATVPREQYQQLLTKYETLLKERQQEAQPMPSDPSTLVDDLNGVSLKPQLAETVDVFGQTQNHDAPIGMAPTANSDNQVEDQIRKLQEAQMMVSKNQMDGALKILRTLDKSPVSQVRVRAKVSMGDMLLAQGEYDLAMQMYEDVIHHEAFSGSVLKVLGKLIVCTEKLKLDKKKAQYYSLLHDFFEAS